MAHNDDKRRSAGTGRRARAEDPANVSPAEVPRRSLRDLEANSLGAPDEGSARRVGAIIEVSEYDFDDEVLAELEKLGVVVQRMIANKLIVDLPLESADSIARTPAVIAVELSRKLRTR